MVFVHATFSAACAHNHATCTRVIAIPHVGHLRSEHGTPNRWELLSRQPGHMQYSPGHTSEPPPRPLPPPCLSPYLCLFQIPDPLSPFNLLAACFTPPLDPRSGISFFGSLLLSSISAMGHRVSSTEHSGRYPYAKDINPATNVLMDKPGKTLLQLFTLISVSL
jgi:hypothetical protein